MSYADNPDPQFDEALALLANDKQSNRLVKEIYLPSIKAFNATQTPPSYGGFSMSYVE